MATTETFDTLKDAADKVSSMKKTPNAAKAYSDVLEKLRSIFNGGVAMNLSKYLGRLKAMG